MKRTTKGDMVLDALNRFPNTATLTLARYLYESDPEVFDSVEHARSSIRYYRGQSGDQLRKECKIKDHFTKPGDERRAYTKIPKGNSNPWKPYQIGQGRYLVIADVHVPFHDETALEIALTHAAENDVTGVLILGDYFDFYKLSRFTKDPRQRNIETEIETGHIIWECMRERLGAVKIYFKIGNHDERYTHYIYRRAPELSGMADFRLERIIKAAEQDVIIIPSDQIAMAGKLPCIHGHEYMRSMMNPVNAARGYFLRAKSDVLGAHYHQASSHNETDITGKEITTWSVGCSCYLHPDYARLNKWSHGFAILDVTEEGNYDVLNKRIMSNGTVRSA